MSGWEDFTSSHTTYSMNERARDIQGREQPISISTLPSAATRIYNMLLKACLCEWERGKVWETGCVFGQLKVVCACVCVWACVFISVKLFFISSKELGHVITHSSKLSADLTPNFLIFIPLLVPVIMLYNNVLTHRAVNITGCSSFSSVTS